MVNFQVKVMKKWHTLSKIAASDDGQYFQNDLETKHQNLYYSRLAFWKCSRHMSEITSSSFLPFITICFDFVECIHKINQLGLWDGCIPECGKEQAGCKKKLCLKCCNFPLGPGCFAACFLQTGLWGKLQFTPDVTLSYLVSSSEKF